MWDRGRKLRRYLRLKAQVVVLAGTAIAMMIGAPLAAGAGSSATVGAGGPPSLGSTVFPSPGQPAASGTGLAATPSAGTAPRTNRSPIGKRIVGRGKRIGAHKAAPALLPRRGRLLTPAVGPLLRNDHNKAKINGQVHLGAAHKGAGPLLTVAPSNAHPPRSRRATPSTFYGSTQLDNFSSQCGFGVNETTIAQSTANPNLLVAGANTYYDNSGGCQDSHAGVYSSSDGGQHWSFQVMPGLVFPSSGDPVVTFDPVRQVFVYAFVEFNRADDSQGRIGVEVSSDGANWSRNVTLDSSNASDGVDKPSITVDQNPGSPHYGRVLVAWTEFFGGNNAVYQTAFSDDGGVNWTGGDASVNQTSHECGNGTSPAFNANGEAMVAWADCTGATNSIFAELSTDGGRTWSTGVDHQITTTHPIAGAEDPNAADCLLDQGGSAFRCNSFPTLAGDPNPGDAGGTAFVVGWAEVRSTTQNSQTANVSQIMGLSTTDDGSTWDHLAFFNFGNFGDKFFPAASFSPSGRLTVSYSSREDDASAANPNGLQFNEHQTEAASLTNLRANSYVTYTADGTLGNPGSLTFIGDYAGNSSLDSNLDTFPVWTDLRSGFPSARTQDLCYSNCPSALSPNSTAFEFRSAGSSFTDFYELSMDRTTGSGANFWNVVGLRPGSGSIDDDLQLAPNHSYSSTLASSAFGAGSVDYVAINGNSGGAPNTVYFPQVHNFSSSGGDYAVQWSSGHIVLGTTFADSMTSADVLRVYDSFLSPSTRYFFGLRPASGNTSTYNVSLHAAGGGPEQSRAAAVASSGQTAAGSPAFASYDTGTDAAAFDGLVVLNNNGGSGGYTIYRDNVAPTGSIKIDKGAGSTTSPSLSLSLNAHNATASDPVAEMAFSVDGGAFTPFTKFAQSFNLNVSGTEGPKTVAVEYRNMAGAVSAPVTATIYLVNNPPTVTSLSPTGGSTAGGNTVTINGSHFAPRPTVMFGSTPATAVAFVSQSQLTAKAPAHALGKIDVTVTTAAGTSAANSGDRYAYGAPTVTSLSPNAGPAAGQNTVTIDGTNFVTGMTVRFGTTASSAVTFVSGTKITAKAPAHAAGTVGVSVTNPAGTSPSSNADLYGYGAPAVTSLNPHSGSAAGGGIVTIGGTGFVPGATVKFDSTAASAVTFVSGTRLTAKAPAHAAGAVHVQVITPAGSSAAANENVYAFGAPTVTSLSPNGGPTGGGNTVTINGHGFAPGAVVQFGGTASSSVTFVSGSQLTAKAPAHSAGSLHVQVHTAAGASASSNGNLYAYGAPAVVSLSPNHGATTGQNTVTINGSGFVPGAAVKFGSASSTAVTFVGGGQIKARAPARAAGSVDVRVHTPAGDSATAAGDHYTYGP